MNLPLAEKGRREPLILAVLVLVSMVVFSYKLGWESYWLDELTTVYRTHIPWSIHYNIWPPLYFWLAWIWAKIFGSSEVALRSFSVLWGVIAVLAAFYMGKIFSLRFGLLLSLLLVFNYTVVRYAQEARAYTMVLAASTIFLIPMIKALRSEIDTKKSWVFLTVIGVLGTLTNYSFALFMISAYISFFLVTLPSHHSVSSDIVKAVCKSLATYISFMTLYGLIVFHYLESNSPYPGDNNFHHIVKDFLFLISCLSPITLAIFIFLLGWSAFIAVKRPTWGRIFLFCLLTLFLFFCSIQVLSLIIHPLWKTRYLIPSIPVLYMAAFYPLSEMPISRAALIMSVWMAISCYTLATNYYGRYHKDDWRGVAEWMMKHNDGEIIVSRYMLKYDCYYLKCDKNGLRCMNFSDFLVKLTNGKVNLNKEKGIWYLAPCFKKGFKDSLERALSKRGFWINKTIRFKGRSRILHFTRCEETP